ncbi:isocitrate lyase [Pseudohyphozyma bogoriensis]|nr:isocitrate lyase [Pseudohyphozyma bogoriensis]
MSSVTTAPSTFQDPSAIASWFASEGQKHWKRSYTPELVASLRQPIDLGCPSNPVALKFREQLKKHEAAGTGSLTYGASDVVTGALMGETGFETLYVSGAGVSFTDVPGTFDMSADQADYPYTTIPAKVKQLFNAQLLHTRLDQSKVAVGKVKKEETFDRLLPIVADGDSGHGSSTATMKMLKCFVDAGVSAVHIDDLLSGVKDYSGYRNHKNHVLVPVSEHIRRMLSAKLQLDVCGSEILLIARTDAEIASHITSTIDPRDRPFILGATTDVESFVAAQEKGQGEAAWDKLANLETLDKTVEKSVEKSVFDKFAKETEGFTIAEALKYIAKEKLPVVWDAECARTVEGWYRYQVGVEAAISRAIALAPYSDISWTCGPGMSYEIAQQFATGVKSAFPNRLLAYNHTAAPGTIIGNPNPTDEEIKAVSSTLGKQGYVWQFMPLGGQIGNAVAMYTYSKSVAEDGILGYHNGVNRAAHVGSVSVVDWVGATGVHSDQITNAIKTTKFIK